MNQSSKAMKLKGDYKETYEKVIQKLNKDILSGEEKETAISDFTVLLTNAQNDETPIAELFPDGIDSFYQSLLEVLPCLTNTDINSKVIKQQKWKKIVAFSSATVALILLLIQIAYFFIHSLYRFEYILDYIFYIVNGFIILFAAIAMLMFYPKKLVAISIVSIFALLMGVNIALAMTNDTKTEKLVSYAPHKQNVLIIKRETETGKAWISTNTKLLFTQFKKQFPYTASKKIKTQWLTGDICAITYTEPNGELHQYVATYGDRGEGISYYYVTSALQGNWKLNSQSADRSIVFDQTGVTLKLSEGEEHYNFDDCVQQGTIALILTENGKAKWTIAMNEDCKLEKDGLVAYGATIELCAVSMNETAPQTYFSTAPPRNNADAKETDEKKAGKALEKSMSDLLTADASLENFQSQQDLVKVVTNSNDFFAIARLAHEENAKQFAINGVDLDVQINELKVIAGDINDFLIEIKTTETATDIESETMDFDWLYRVKKGKGVYLATRVGYQVDGTVNISKNNSPEMLDTRNNSDYHFFVAGIKPNAQTTQPDTANQPSSENQTPNPEPIRQIISITIPEGWTAMQIANSLEEKGICQKDAFFQAAQNYQVQSFTIPTSANRCFKLEGYLFPDTYEFYQNEDPVNIIRKMLNNYASKSGMPSDDTLILASIIEKEARSDTNMKLVSSVFQNRIAQQMRLEADSTRAYVNNFITNNPLLNGTEKYAALYNTYKCSALPAGPICNPSTRAIAAAQNPTVSDYLFFFFGNDNENHYSKTLAEHNEQMKKFGVQYK